MPLLLYRKNIQALKKARVKKKVLSEFIALFSFDFEHTGYSKDNLPDPNLGYVKELERERFK